jgi:probable rRNA maturation factor
MIFVDIDEEFSAFVDPQMLVDAAEAVLAHEEMSEQVELSIAVSNDDTIRALNAQYRDTDAPTDVLSFPSDEFDPDEQVQYLGDIMISFPRALAQAEAAQHPVMNEIRLLVVHGVLHILGYDHLEPEEKAEMWAIQADILAAIGCSINQLPEN